MHARLSEAVLQSPEGREMGSILRSCVHCGFCNATCPTYQIKGNELDGPRGRIYLMKSMLEDESVSESTQIHLDRCLTCRSCETTCPSGVHYSRLLELARPMVDRKVGRSPIEWIKRRLIALVVPYTKRFAAAMNIARFFRVLMPRALSEMVPAAPGRRANPRTVDSDRHMLLFDGCVQHAVSPGINLAAADILASQGISAASEPSAGCCGAVAYHLGDVDEARACAIRNIDAWHDALDKNSEAIVVTSSGCAVMLKEYESLLADDGEYAERAARVSRLVHDPAELLDPERISDSAIDNPVATKVAFHPPCTMQHGSKTNTQQKVSACLRAAGFQLTAIPDSHLCCGSAGSYSLLQSEMASELLDRKLMAIGSGDPEIIASANIGCLMHLQRRADKPVLHWLELIRPRISEP